MRQRHVSVYLSQYDELGRWLLNTTYVIPVLRSKVEWIILLTRVVPVLRPEVEWAILPSTASVTWMFAHSTQMTGPHQRFVMVPRSEGSEPLTMAGGMSRYAEFSATIGPVK